MVSVLLLLEFLFFIFFFNDTATTEIYTLSLHDALPIWAAATWDRGSWEPASSRSRSRITRPGSFPSDRKSTRLNSSHTVISYAVFCLKKKKNKTQLRGKAGKCN